MYTDRHQQKCFLIAYFKYRPNCDLDCRSFFNVLFLYLKVLNGRPTTEYVETWYGPIFSSGVLVPCWCITLYSQEPACNWPLVPAVTCVGKPGHGDLVAWHKKSTPAVAPHGSEVGHRAVYCLQATRLVDPRWRCLLGHRPVVHKARGSLPDAGDDTLVDLVGWPVLLHIPLYTP